MTYFEFLTALSDYAEPGNAVESLRVCFAMGYTPSKETVEAAKVKLERLQERYSSDDEHQERLAAILNFLRAFELNPTSPPSS